MNTWQAAAIALVGTVLAWLVAHPLLVVAVVVAVIFTAKIVLAVDDTSRRIAERLGSIANLLERAADSAESQAERHVEVVERLTEKVTDSLSEIADRLDDVKSDVSEIKDAVIELQTKTGDD